MTDEAGTFQQLGWNFATHQTVNRSKDEYVRREGDWVVTTNTIEDFSRSSNAEFTAFISTSAKRTLAVI